MLDGSAFAGDPFHDLEKEDLMENVAKLYQDLDAQFSQATTGFRSVQAKLEVLRAGAEARLAAAQTHDFDPDSAGQERLARQQYFSIALVTRELDSMLRTLARDRNRLVELGTAS
ncbi:Hypothetical protein NGAL_HAMBI1146_31960 [Neorhizobium galegae bv. officinalis]|uniref:hypothetical protein n=1 Tax=Neorhizobium sp. T6_25 TaxID=2093833 RepID=UPI000621D53A|nr:hypothetical protein [Neorhizobium sp. T6_25]CDZ39062.1 Hypothetical protein NGAL_HAMBI1146_31960 [Neorhizobium galegae bv. officinalis]